VTVAHKCVTRDAASTVVNGDSGLTLTTTQEKKDHYGWLYSKKEEYDRRTDETP
jgi:hypothetical protein